MSGFRRWVFADPTTMDVYTVPLNPREMTSPFPARGTRTVPLTRDGRARSVRNQTPPQEWSFGGAIREATHHDALLTWSKKEYRIHVIDHIGRGWIVLPIVFEPTELRPTRRHADRWTYRFRCLLYGSVPPITVETPTAQMLLKLPKPKPKIV